MKKIKNATITAYISNLFASNFRKKDSRLNHKFSYTINHDYHIYSARQQTLSPIHGDLLYFQDILKFMLLFIVVIGSFMVGLHNLYWYYSVHDDIEITDHEFQFKAEKYFGT